MKRLLLLLAALGLVAAASAPAVLAADPTTPRTAVSSYRSGVT